MGSSAMPAAAAARARAIAIAVAIVAIAIAISSSSFAAAGCKQEVAAGSRCHGDDSEVVAGYH